MSIVSSEFPAESVLIDSPSGSELTEREELLDMYSDYGKRIGERIAPIFSSYYAATLAV